MEKRCVYETGTFPSADGSSSIAYYCFLPEGAPRAIVQISHGMCEYFLRYTPLAQYLTARGYAVCGHDHTGHGASVASPEALGLTGGAEAMVTDVKMLTEILRERFPSTTLVLLGHSMGSFVARLYAERYPDAVDGLVIVGTGGPDNPTGVGKALARLTEALRGKGHRSGLITTIAFGSYNKGLDCEKGKKAWLTRDQSVVDAYAADPLCNYTFTARGYYDLFDLIGLVSRKAWAGMLPKELPMLLLSGERDPVGGYGKGVRKVYERLCNAGIKDVKLMLYPEMRHEVLNEIGKETVFFDLAAWLEEHGF